MRRMPGTTRSQRRGLRLGVLVVLPALLAVQGCAILAHPDARFAPGDRLAAATAPAPDCTPDTASITVGRIVTSGPDLIRGYRQRWQDGELQHSDQMAPTRMQTIPANVLGDIGGWDVWLDPLNARLAQRDEPVQLVDPTHAGGGSIEPTASGTFVVGWASTVATAEVSIRCADGRRIDLRVSAPEGEPSWTVIECGDATEPSLPLPTPEEVLRARETALLEQQCG